MLFPVFKKLPASLNNPLYGCHFLVLYKCLVSPYPSQPTRCKAFHECSFTLFMSSDSQKINGAGFLSSGSALRLSCIRGMSILMFSRDLPRPLFLYPLNMVSPPIIIELGKPDRWLKGEWGVQRLCTQPRASFATACPAFIRSYGNRRILSLQGRVARIM